MEENNFILMLQAMLDKVKSVTNIKKDIKSIEPKLKIKLKGVLDKSFKKDMNTTLKTIKPKIKIDADTSKAVQKIKRIGKQKTSVTIQPTVDNSQVISSLKETQKETKSLFDRFLNGVVGVNLVRMSVQKVTQAIYQAIAGLKELDKIKTDIQMVSGTSDSGVDAMMQSYNSMAKELSSTTKSVSEAANEFLRMGESVASTNELIKSSQVLSKVGMIESSEAASYLISSLKGYKVEAEDSINIIDKLTSVDLEAAVSCAGLAEAMSRCANIANNSGITMDRLIGYTATVGEVTQKSMSEVGNSFQSLLSRMNNIKIGRFIDDETGESLSDTESVLNKLGIQIRDTENTYRSFDDVLDDVGNHWKDFTKVEQNAISVAIAGTRQRENFESLMNNWGNALKYSETAANSAGSALERYGMYQDSIEAKTNELTAAIESLSTNTISEDLFSGIIQATAGVVEFIDKFGILKGTLAGLVAMGISKTFVSMATGIISAAKSTTQLTAAMAMFDKGTSIANLQSIGAACKGLSDKQLKLVLSTKGLGKAQRLAILEGMGVAEAEREQTLATLGLASAENTATVSTFSLKNAWDALKIAVASNPIGAVLTAITTVVSVATMAFSFFNQQVEEAAQKAKEAADAYKESSSSIEEYTTKYSELREQLIAARGNEEETYNVKKQLLDLQTELNEKYGEEHGYLNLVTDAYNDQTEAIKELNKEEAKRFLNENEQGISTAERKMESGKTYDLSYAIAKTPDNERFMEEIVGKYEKDGMSILDAGESFYIKLDADPKDAYETINSFMTDVNEKAKALGNENLFKDTVSNIASDSLNKAKETLDKYQEIYKQAKMAEIASDDNLSEGYNEAVSAVEAYNEAVLKSEDPYNDESVNKAWNDLQTVRQGIQENKKEWGEYSSVMEDVFSAANDDVYSFYQALQDDTEITKLAGKLKGLSDVDLQAMADVDNGDAFDILYAEAEEYGLEVQELIDLLVRLGYVQGKISEEAQDTSIPSFSEAFGSLDTDIQQKLLDLAKSGEITSDVLVSTEEYNALLTQTGMSADSAKNQILDMLSAQEKLSGASQGLGKLKSSYEEFKDLGFVTAQSLESLPDAFKELEGYDLFSQIVGDPTQGAGKIQEAFNGIVKEYILSQDTLSGLINASESDIQSYIANLREMGITNAEEVVNAAIQAMSQESELLNAAEEEYINYLDAKEGYDDEYLKSVISKNSQLAAALGEPYKADYDNWCDLLSKKAQAYNKFVSLLNSSQQAANFSGSPLSDYGKAKEIMKESAGKNLQSIAPQVSGFANQKNLSAYTKEQVDAAKEYVSQYEQAQKLKDELKFDLSSIDPDFSTGYSPKGSGGSGGSGSGGSKKEETKKEFSEVFDWIERRLKKFQKSFDKWVSQAETAVTSGFVNKYYRKAASAARKQVSAYGKAYSRYMAQADSVGLDEKYAKKVRNGTIDIESIRAEGTEEEIKKYEELAEKIKEYQGWYDKAQDSMDSFAEAAEKLYALPLDKAARKTELFSEAIDLLGKRLDNAIYAKTKNKLVDRQTTEERKTLNAQKSARKETGKSLKAAKRELRKGGNLNADDGITKKERSKIKSAVKKNKEVNLSFFRENSAGYRAAVKYNEALKANRKATDEAKAAQLDYNKWLVEAGKMKFDNIADKYEKKLQMIGYEMSALDNKVAEIEAAGRKVDKSYYESQKKVNAKTLAKYKAEKAALEESIKGIKPGTDEWYDAKDAIQQVDDAISGCVVETYDLNNAINQLHFDLFDGVSDSIKRVITEQEFLQGLFAHEKNTDKETGGFTEAGIAKLGSLSASYHASKSNEEKDAAEVRELQRMFDSGTLHSDLLGITFNSLDDLKAKLDDTYTKWQDDIKETYSLETEINDLMKEKYQAELDMLKELIDAKKEALQSEKDLHDYNKTLNEKTESIATIQKQIAAYSGDSSQEGMAKLQKLQKELADREEDLRETEYDRYISDQEEMLDRLYGEYEELMTKKLDDFMLLVKEGLQTAEENTSIISSYLSRVASDNGYTEETKGLFNGVSATISGNVDRVIAAISSDISSRSGTGDGNAQGNSGGSTQGSNGATGSKNGSGDAKTDKTDWKSSVRDYIRDNAAKATKKKSEYGDVNKAVYDNKGKLYQGKGKVLPSKALKGLAELIGVRYTGNNSKDGAFYKKLKSLKIPGFSKGGVVDVDDIEKQVHDNGDTSLVSVQSGEGILTKEETEAVKELADNAGKSDKTVMINGVECTQEPQEDLLKGLVARSHQDMDTSTINVSIDDFINAVKDIKPDIESIVKGNMPNTQYITNNNANNAVNIDMGGITMNGVNDPEEFSNNLIQSMKKYPKVQNAIHAIETNRLGGGGRLGVNRIR